MLQWEKQKLVTIGFSLSGQGLENVGRNKGRPVGQCRDQHTRPVHSDRAPIRHSVLAIERACVHDNAQCASDWVQCVRTVHTTQLLKCTMLCTI